MRNSIKTYVDSKTMKVFLAITFKEKRFYICTGLTTSEKFKGMAFPPSTSNHIAKTKRLVSLYAEIEKCMLNNPDDLFSTFKEKVKSIVGIKIEVEKNLLYYIDEYIKTKVKSSTQQVFLTTRARIETLWIVPQQFKLTTFDAVQLTYPARGRTLPLLFEWYGGGAVPQAKAISPFLLGTARALYLLQLPPLDHKSCCLNSLTSLTP